ncbi:Hypothetical protein Ccan_03630 [Capnocytophaga canimorsus Cc5]|uniref:Uncharacterized protein n=1 Tax=Capnocytophaga canimorsus (strain 5) TaxID=860228 RepID=F9YRC7_CAPCC|nr:Hypothetical protein Ccan_03630 [Capnocytophaga canimorsus Cc5]
MFFILQSKKQQNMLIDATYMMEPTKRYVFSYCLKLINQKKVINPAKVNKKARNFQKNEWVFLKIDIVLVLPSEL